MKRTMIVAAACFGVSGITILGLAVITRAIRMFGYEWSSLTGPGPTWPAVVGFGAMNLMALSAAALVVVLLVVGVRRILRRRVTR